LIIIYIVASELREPVYTRDGKLSAQFEHTIAVTRTGVQVLTLRPGESALCPVAIPA
jgi:methionyl aminopeptidase